MTDTHTPGPWVVGRRDDDGNGMDFLIDAPHKTTAFIGAAFDISNREEQAANARLIAAAPDLKNVCKDAARLDHLAERLRKDVRPGHVDYISKADAADILDRIAKEARATIAKGES